MSSPESSDVFEKELARDLSRKPLWYGIVYGKCDKAGEPTGSIGAGKVDFLVNAGGLTEAHKLVREYPLKYERLPAERTVYISPMETGKAFDRLFGNDQRLAVRVLSVEGALRHPEGTAVVLPCLSKKWRERVMQTEPLF